MKANIGGIDKVLRIVVGLALLSIILFVEGPNRWWGLIGIIPLGTGLINFCPLYSIFGLSTCPTERKGA